MPCPISPIEEWAMRMSRVKREAQSGGGVKTVVSGTCALVDVGEVGGLVVEVMVSEVS